MNWIDRTYFEICPFPDINLDYYTLNYDFRGVYTSELQTLPYTVDALLSYIMYKISVNFTGEIVSEQTLTRIKVLIKDVLTSAYLLGKWSEDEIADVDVEMRYPECDIILAPKLGLTHIPITITI